MASYSTHALWQLWQACIEGCLYTAGRGAFSNVQTARQRKAEWFYRDRDSFMQQLIDDIAKFQIYCHEAWYSTLCKTEWHNRY